MSKRITSGMLRYAAPVVMWQLHQRKIPEADMQQNGKHAEKKML
jgi:hypothetical protein